MNMSAAVSVYLALTAGSVRSAPPVLPAKFHLYQLQSTGVENIMQVFCCDENHVQQFIILTAIGEIGRTGSHCLVAM